MPDMKGRQTAKERVFVERMAATNDHLYAAAKAGYAVPAQGAHKALARPQIQQEIRARQLARMNNELLPLALDVISDILSSKTATERGKLMAAKIVIDRTTGAGDGAEAKEPHEMSAAELQARIEALRREASDRAKPVVEVEANAQLEEPDTSVFD